MTDLKKYEFKLPKAGQPAVGATTGWGRPSGAPLQATVAPTSDALPSDPAACLARGNAWLQNGRVEDALRAYDRAIALKPDYLDPHFNRGNALLRLQRLPEALADFERAAELSPELAIAHYNRATILATLGRVAEAMAGYQRTLALDPTMVQARFNLGNLYQQQGDAEQALACMDAVIAQSPNVAQAHINRGTALLSLKRPSDAGQSFDRALALQAQSPEALINRANARLQLKHYDAAAKDLNEALRLNPKLVPARRLLGALLRETGEAEQALAELQQAYDLAPDTPGALSDLVATLAMTCDWQRLPQGIARLEAAVREGRSGVAPLVVLDLIDSPDLQLASARLAVAADCPPSASLGPLVRRTGGGKIRVGYYSPDFHDTAVARQVAELLDRHDRGQFEWLAFAYGPIPHDDAVRARLRKSFDQFHDLRDSSDHEVARKSREMGIDIAVDLSGFGPGGRLGMFAHRCAPVQISYLGYPGSTGADYMDYVIADKVALPPAAHAQFSEKVVTLPHSHQLGGHPHAPADRVWTREEADLPAEGFVFCCFSPAYRILPSVFDSWLRMLQAAPGSILWLLEDNPAATRHLRERAQAQGVDAARLRFAPSLPRPEHLARHRLADLMLDTLPANAASAANDALAAGVPVLTQTGAAFAGRVTASLLTTAGLPELITASQPAYEARALELARDAAPYQAVRARLQASLSSSPLFNAKRLARQLEAAYAAVDERSIQGMAPKAIDVRA